jgi:HlyD family secretion protein
VSTAFCIACGGSADGPPALGTLERDRIELVSEADEPVVALEVREGDRARAGQLLLRLDGRRLAAQVAGARARSDEARARLDELIEGPRKERILEAQARLEGAEGALASAVRERERVKRLAEQGLETASRVDALQSQLDLTLAERSAAAARLAELLAGTRREEIDRARSGLAAAEAALVDLELRLERLEVRAPQSGTVDALPYELGERPPPGAVVCVMLADGLPYARVHVPAVLKPDVIAGTAARVRVDGSAEAFAGRVRWISHRAAFTPFFALTTRDRGRLSYLAEVELLGAEAHALSTGVPVEVSFELSAKTADAR